MKVNIGGRNMADQNTSTRKIGRKYANTLIEESILPVWITEKKMTWLGFVWIWIGLSVTLNTFQYGANTVMGGLNLVQATILITVSNAVLAVIMTLTGDIGTEHGLSMATYLRAPFGIEGSNIAALSRGIVGAAWLGIATYLGALAMNGVIEYITGFEFWPLWYILLLGVQLATVAAGMKSIENLAAFAAPAIIAVSVWMYFTVDGIADLNGINIWSVVGEGGNTSLIALFIANMTVWAAMALDSCNLTRWIRADESKNFFKRNKNVFPGHFIALPITHGWIAFIGAASYLATGNWNPIDVIQEQSTGFALVGMLALIILGQWSTTVTANVLPSALTFINAGKGKISYKMGILLSGVVATVTMPWLLLENLFVFLSYYGGFVGSIAGIMICDYFVIRKRRLNVPDLYNHDGQFRYSNGWNPAAIIAFFVPAILAFLNLDYSYVIGLPLGFLIYWILMETWILKKHKQVERESDYSDEYLATSVGQSWLYDEGMGFSRVESKDLPESTRTDS